MKLYEFEAKEIARRYGVQVPKGYVASNPEEVYEYSSRIGGQVVLKSQVLVGGRGLAGGVVFANSPDEAFVKARNLLGSRIRGEIVEKVLVEEKICIERELYLSLTVDRGLRKLVYLASPLGGVEVEDLVKKHPEKLLKIAVDPVVGYRQFYSRALNKFLQLHLDLLNQLDSIMKAMFNIALDLDAELVEFNPLALTCSNELVALDAKIIIDDNSLFKHPEFMEKHGRDLSLYERKARELGFSYVELDGEVGVVANGAGLTMATMDTLLLHGVKPANFLDVGGGASADRVYSAVKLLLEHPKVKAVFINIFGGITRCDEIANGVVKALGETGFRKPVVVRMLGTNEEEGRRILLNSGIRVYTEVDDAIIELRRAVEAG